MRPQKNSIKPSAHHNQQGVVSIMVVSVLIILLSLVTIGFARLMNRETRQALDRQLGVQSYYAAESGINDAIRYMDDQKAKGNLGNAAITKCSEDKGKLNQNLSGDSTTNPNAQYSCVLINPNPDSLIYNIKSGQSKVFSVDQARLTSLLISWQNSGEIKNNNYRANGSKDFPSNASWGGKTGTLRVSIYPIMINPKIGYNPYPSADNPDPTTATFDDSEPVAEYKFFSDKGVDDRAITAKYSRTFFLYPDRAANPANSLTPVDYYENNGATITGQCDDNRKTINDPAVKYPGPAGSPVYHCNSILNCLPDAFTGQSGAPSLAPNQKKPFFGPFGCPAHGNPITGDYRAQHYIVKITSLYADTDVLLRSAESYNLTPVSLIGAQAVIDSTGKGSDVLRRISARIAISPNGNGEVSSDLVGPETALRTAETVCKRIRQLVTSSVSVDDLTDPACAEGINP